MKYINHTQEVIFEAIKKVTNKFNSETVTALWQSNGGRNPIVYIGFNNRNPSATGVQLHLRDIDKDELEAAGIKAWPYWEAYLD